MNIYEKYNLDRLHEFNLVGRIKKIGLFNKGYQIHPQTQLISRAIKGDIETPWIHIKVDPVQHCAMYLIIFDALGFIPARCMECWKVVVKPRTVEELILLYERMKTMGYYSKCGIEERDYVKGNYGAYFYTQSLEEGLERKKEVRAAVDSVVGENVEVYLKRYCTEFEIKTGSSRKYERPPNADKWEAIFWDNFALDPEFSPQSEAVKTDIKFRWMLFAAARDDPTIELFNNGNPVNTAIETY